MDRLSSVTAVTARRDIVARLHRGGGRRTRVVHSNTHGGRVGRYKRERHVNEQGSPGWVSRPADPRQRTALPTKADPVPHTRQHVSRGTLFSVMDAGATSALEYTMSALN